MSSVLLVALDDRAVAGLIKLKCCHTLVRARLHQRGRSFKRLISVAILFDVP